MTDAPRQHWDNVYAVKAPDQVSWYQAAPTRSMALIRATNIPVEAPLIDIGGGTSTLVDNLCRSGYTDVTVLDISAAALNRAKKRLGAGAGAVSWIEADVTAFEPRRRYQLWHDRALFHFMIDAAQRQQYLDTLRAALIPGGHFVLSTFGPEGPDKCSGLPVQRYSVQHLTDVLAPDFELRSFDMEDHRTPTGTVQQFLYSWWQAGD
jgi:ubiquinone/menaquinone biosynthesis C-methylase UbiE